MAASSSGEGFWFSDSRSYHQPVHHGDPMMGIMDDEETYDEYGYLPYVCGNDGCDPNVNWEERCIELEMSLQRFRDQAGKIRGLLREKVSPSFRYFQFEMVVFSHLFLVVAFE